MALDLTDDHLVLDGLEDISLDGFPWTHNAYRGDIVDREAATSDGVYLWKECEWQLPTVGLLGGPPRVGQPIVDMAARLFTILEVRQPFLNDYWGCRCRVVSIESDLAWSDKVTRYPAVVSLDEEGSRVVSHPASDPAFVGVPAKVQVMPCTIAEFMGKRGFDRLYYIYVERDITLNYGDLLLDARSVWYDVISWENRESVDGLSCIITHQLN